MFCSNFSFNVFNRKSWFRWKARKKYKRRRTNGYDKYLHIQASYVFTMRRFTLPLSLLPPLTFRVLFKQYTDNYIRLEILLLMTRDFCDVSCRFDSRAVCYAISSVFANSYSPHTVLPSVNWIDLRRNYRPIGFIRRYTVYRGMFVRNELKVKGRESQTREASDKLSRSIKYWSGLPRIYQY